VNIGAWFPKTLTTIQSMTPEEIEAIRAVRLERAQRRAGSTACPLLSDIFNDVVVVSDWLKWEKLPDDPSDEE
jgi:hypothetical protein